jgi:hypothetical protein
VGKGEHQAATAHVAQAEGPQTRGEALALGRDLGEEALVVHHLEHGRGGRGDERAARKRRAVVAGAKDVAQLGGGQAGADGQPAAESLGHGHHVGTDAEPLVGPQGARPAGAALDLVEHEQRTGLIAGLAGRGDHLGADWVDARLALDRLDEDRRGALADRVGERGGVVARHDPEPGHERLEGLLPGRRGRGREGPERAAVEGVLEHDDLAARTMAAHELDRALGGLGAGVAEERLAPERALGQPPGEAQAGLGVEEVGHVDQPRCLLPDSRDEPGVPVADLGH